MKTYKGPVVFMVLQVVNKKNLENEKELLLLIKNMKYQYMYHCGTVHTYSCTYIYM